MYHFWFNCVIVLIVLFFVITIVNKIVFLLFIFPVGTLQVVLENFPMQIFRKKTIQVRDMYCWCI
jgi:hypothetical protein